MKRFGMLLLLIACMFSLCGCGLLLMSDRVEKSVYHDAITTLFKALDAGDRDGVRLLFSPYVQAQDENLDADIEKLFSVYHGPMDEIGWDGLLAGSYTNHYGDRERSVYAHFPVRCGDIYYWCDLELMYENTVDSSQIGVTQLSFYTADEWCLNAYDDDATWCDEAGLSVFADRSVDEEIRCICGNPYLYQKSEEPLDLEEVEAFFEKSNSYSEFVGRFGEPNAENYFIYYELPPENGEPRYLQISHDDWNGKIYGACIVDQFAYIDTVYEAE
jgi:hypothetical protein